MIESEVTTKDFGRNWARLIQKIYNVDPLECKKCRGVMKIITFIEHEAVIEKIAEFAQGMGLVSGGVTQSPLIGPAGNKEFFIHLLKAERDGGESGPAKE